MTIGKKEVEHVANLARLAISEEEKSLFAAQLTQIVNHIEKLNELNTDTVPPTLSSLKRQIALREDEVVQRFDKNLMENAPSSEKQHYRVPKIID